MINILYDIHIYNIRYVIVLNYAYLLDTKLDDEELNYLETYIVRTEF